MTFISPPLDLFKPLRAGWAIVTAIAVHLLFALSFVIVLAMATSRAQAQDVVCEGNNLLDIMALEQPDALAELEAEAAKIPNGDSLLWRVDKGGTEPSWLYGTMHVADPRVLEMNESARSAYDNADTVVVELTEVTNLEAAMAGLMADPGLTMLPDGKTLQDLLDKEDLAEIEAILMDRGIPMTFVSRMKPWMVFSLISVPECELARRSKGEDFLDKQLATGALERGKALKGLETLKEQLAVLSGLPLDMQAVLLADTAALGTVLNDATTTMTELYLEGKVGMIMPLLQSATVDPNADEDRTGVYAKFEQDLIQSRNHTMAERARPMLNKGNAFVAVGALHLPGEEGLVQLLRNDGYTVTAIR